MRTAAERGPSGDELLAMRYVDGELGEEERRAFERRLADEPRLRREVAELHEVAVLARVAAPVEPMDLEWQALERGWVQRGGSRLGLFLCGTGAAGLVGWGEVAIARSDLPLVPKACVLALGTGLVVLLALAVRARLRTAPLDPYREVVR